MSFKVTNFGTNQKPICDFLLVINTNLHRISHRFEVIADYWSNLHFRQRGTPIWHTHSGWTPKLRTTKFSLKKLETLLYCMLFINLQTIISFCHNTVAAGEYRVKIAVFEAGWVILTQNFTQKGTSPTISAQMDRLVNALQLCRWQFSHTQTLHNWTFFARCFRFVTMHAFDRRTDGQTDRQNLDSNTVRVLSSRTVKTTTEWLRHAYVMITVI